MTIQHTRKSQIFIITCLVFAFSSLVWARSLNEIKQSMIQRAPLIKQLKAKGIVGENNSGYLAFVGSAKANEAQVAAENKDRRAIYSYVAKKENASLSVVEKRQGARKAQKAKPGEFFQKPDGAWKKR